MLVSQRLSIPSQRFKFRLLQLRMIITFKIFPKPSLKRSIRPRGIKAPHTANHFHRSKTFLRPRPKFSSKGTYSQAHRTNRRPVALGVSVVHGERTHTWPITRDLRSIGDRPYSGQLSFFLSCSAALPSFAQDCRKVD
jgi:hypothetical protein